MPNGNHLRDQIEELESRWEHALLKYPALISYGRRPWNDKGEFPRAALDAYKHLAKTTEAQIPAPMVDRTPVEKLLGREKPFGWRQFLQGELLPWLPSAVSAGMATTPGPFGEREAPQHLLPPEEPKGFGETLGEIKGVLAGKESFPEFVRRTNREAREIRKGAELDSTAEFIARLIPGVATEALLTGGPGGAMGIGRAMKTAGRAGGENLFAPKPGVLPAVARGVEWAYKPIADVEEMTGAGIAGAGRLAKLIGRRVTGFEEVPTALTQIDAAARREVSTAPTSTTRYNRFWADPEATPLPRATARYMEEVEGFPATGTSLYGPTPAANKLWFEGAAARPTAPTTPVVTERVGEGVLPVKPGMTRLYRVELTELPTPRTPEADASWRKAVGEDWYKKFEEEKGRLFSDSLEKLEVYGHGSPNHTTYFVDIPTSKAKATARQGFIGNDPNQPITEYFLDSKVAAGKQVFTAPPTPARAAAPARIIDDVVTGITENVGGTKVSVPKIQTNVRNWFNRLLDDPKLNPRQKNAVRKLISKYTDLDDAGIDDVLARARVGEVPVPTTATARKHTVEELLEAGGYKEPPLVEPDMARYVRDSEYQKGWDITWAELKPERRAAIHRGIAKIGLFEGQAAPLNEFIEGRSGYSYRAADTVEELLGTERSHQRGRPFQWGGAFEIEFKGSPGTSVISPITGQPHHLGAMIGDIDPNTVTRVFVDPEYLVAGIDPSDITKLKRTFPRADIIEAVVSPDDPEDLRIATRFISKAADVPAPTRAAEALPTPTRAAEALPTPTRAPEAALISTARRGDEIVEEVVEPTVVSDIIGLNRIPSGFTRADKWKNLARIVLGKAGWDRTSKPLLHKVITPLFRDRLRTKTSINSGATVFGHKMGRLALAFERDANGGIPSLAGHDPTVLGAPTIQDVAARLPRFWERLTPKQRESMKSMRQLANEYHDLRNRYGISVFFTGSRQDVIDGGFYLSRGFASSADDLYPESPIRHNVQGAIFDKPAVFSSQSLGISKGWEYMPFENAMAGYAKNVGHKVLDIHTARYMKTLSDESGGLIGSSPKLLARKQDPQLVDRMDRLRDRVAALRSTRLRLDERMYKNFEDFLHDPDFEDVDSLLDSLRRIEATVKRGRLKGADRDQIGGIIQGLKKELDDLRPEYKALLERVKKSGRVGRITLPTEAGLSDWYFPDEIARAANEVLEAEKGVRLGGALGTTVDRLNDLNNLYRGVGATMDVSYPGIQGLVGFYNKPQRGVNALEVSIKAFGGKRSEQILAAFFDDFDKLVVPQGRLSVSGWASQGLHIGGEVSEFQLKGRLQRLPLVRRSNRAFGVAGDSMRLRWADDELVKEMAKGRSLQEITSSGDLERIANSVNGMTGWSPNRAFNDVGDLLLFAPRFLQSRLDTLARAGRSVRPGATLDEQMARRALLRMISYGTLLTVGLNMAFADERPMKGQPSWLGWTKTDFRPMVDGRRNSNFMRVFTPFGDVSLFGTWDSLLGAMLTIMAGDPKQAGDISLSGTLRGASGALRAMGGGFTTVAWDMIKGEDFLRRRTRDTPEQFMHWILRTFTPFAAEETIPAAADIARGLYSGLVHGKPEPSQVAKGVAIGTLEVTGIKRVPQTAGEQKQRLGKEAWERGVGGTFGDRGKQLGYTLENAFSQEELNRTPDEYWQYDRATREELKASPEFVALAKESERYNPERTEYIKNKDRRWEAMFGGEGTLAKLAILSAGNDPEHPMKELRLKMPEHLNNFYAIEGYAQKEAKEKGIFGEDREPEGPLRQAEDIYNRLLWAEDMELVKRLFPNQPYIPIEDALTKDENWDERDRRVRYLEETYGKKFVSDMKDLSRADLPKAVRDVREAMDYISERGYWEAYDRAAMKLELSKEWETYKNLPEGRQKRALRDGGVISLIESQGGNERLLMRLRDPELEKTLQDLGYVMKPIGEGFSPKQLEQIYLGVGGMSRAESMLNRPGFGFPQPP